MTEQKQIVFTLQQVNQILTVLGQFPFSQVNGAINDIQRICQMQLAQKATPPAPPAAVAPAPAPALAAVPSEAAPAQSAT